MHEAFVDIHHHLLYGLDDGPVNRDEMERMIAAAAADGAQTVIATPHVLPGIKPFDWQQYERALWEANDCCRRQGLGLRILGGAEILFTQSTVRMLREGLLPTLNASRYVLVEWAGEAAGDDVAAAARAIANAGFVPVLAHAERLSCFRRRPEQLLHLRQEGCLRIQVNASSLLKLPFSRSARLAQRLYRMQLVDYVASDAHNVQDRPTQMTAAYEKMGRRHGRRLAEQVFIRNPRELLIWPADNDFPTR